MLSRSNNRGSVNGHPFSEMNEQEAAETTHQRPATESADLNTNNSNPSKEYETLRYPKEVVYDKLADNCEIGIIYSANETEYENVPSNSIAEEPLLGETVCESRVHSPPSL